MEGLDDDVAKVRRVVDGVVFSRNSLRVFGGSETRALLQHFRMGFPPASTLSSCFSLLQHGNRVSAFLYTLSIDSIRVRINLFV